MPFNPINKRRGQDTRQSRCNHGFFLNPYEFISKTESLLEIALHWLSEYDRTSHVTLKHRIINDIPISDLSGLRSAESISNLFVNRFSYLDLFLKSNTFNQFLKYANFRPLKRNEESASYLMVLGKHVNNESVKLRIEQEIFINKTEYLLAKTLFWLSRFGKTAYVALKNRIEEDTAYSNLVKLDDASLNAKISHMYFNRLSYLHFLLRSNTFDMFLKKYAKFRQLRKNEIPVSYLLKLGNHVINQRVALLRSSSRSSRIPSMIGPEFYAEKERSVSLYNGDQQSSLSSSL